ncbi:hypothetical protein EUX98_g7915 [Antrodiella citrinella]|uniref:DUF6532 domain-containing protein n=1 Tax=Antrodiella citrinella TaxID=2447956 RepID=A0A4S4MJ90_9APHY|nr:hypothetical protein EUX98_g7915 [Antrodiella citrinella]
MAKVVTKAKVKGNTPNVGRPKPKATPATQKLRTASQPVPTESNVRPARISKTNANAKWEDLLPGRKRAHSDTQPQLAKRVKSDNGPVAKNAKRSKAVTTAPAKKLPATPKDAPHRQAMSSTSKSTGVARRAVVPRHNEDSDDGGPDYTAAERYQVALDKMGLDPSESPSEFEGSQVEVEVEDDNDDDNDNDNDNDDKDVEQDVDSADEEEYDEDGDEDDVGPQEVPAWTADLREDSPLPDFFTDAPRPSARKTTKPARGVSRLSPDASDEDPIIRVKNLAEGLFDDDLDVLKTKVKPRKTTAAQLLKKAKEEPVFYDSEADVDSDGSEPEDNAGMGDDEDLELDDDDMWPAWTNLQLNHKGVANLTLQHRLVRRAVNQAIKFIEHDFAFVTGYPEILGKTQYVDENIVAGAQCAQVPPVLVKRFIEDEDFRHALTLHTCNRLSHARKDLKNIVAGQIVPLLNLSPHGTLLPAPTIQKIIQDLLVNRAYLYPPTSDTNSRPCMSQPCQSPIVLEVLRLAYFR